MIGTHSRAEYRVIMTAVSAVCALGAVSAVIPAVEHAVTLGLVALGLLGLLVVGLRLLARWLRERRENREDEITAAAWRAAHQPVAAPIAGAE
jgi:Ni/Fe-hydrogenase subunit HybB-like protein